ncbi:MAG: hypothetical protein ACXVUE_11875 [Solirubrobacteraceae bacterium]
MRPSLKDRYPITPIEQYVTWTRENGEPFDPWIRIHTRRGGQIVKAIPHSMRITGTVAEWEQWTRMKFPGDGQYTFPAGSLRSTLTTAKTAASTGSQTSGSSTH